MKRNYGIDVARVVAIWFVVCGHIVTCGGILTNVPKGAWPLCMTFLDCLTVGCVDIFALISGYVGLNGRHHFSSIVGLWLQVFVINAVLTLSFILFANVAVDLRDVFFPVLRRSYWYFTAYFPLFFLMPILNEGIKKMSQTKCRILCTILVGVLSFSRLFVSQDPFILNGGYSFAWLLVLYVVGGCLNRSEFRISKGICFIVFAICVSATWGVTLCLGRNVRLQSALHGINPFYGYTSPTVLCSAIFLILGLSACSSFFEKYKRVIGFFSVSAFGVYLIHVQPNVWNRLFVGKFQFLNNYGGGLLFAIIGISVGIYITCSCLEWIRILLFRCLHIQERLQFLDRIVKESLE